MQNKVHNVPSLRRKPSKALVRARWTAAFYGLPFHKLRELLEHSDGRCMICGRIPSKRLHIDHDHTSGEVRGLLCHGCNTGLGLFKDSEDLLWKAIEYLRTKKF